MPLFKLFSTYFCCNACRFTRLILSLPLTVSEIDLIRDESYLLSPKPEYLPTPIELITGK